MKFGFPSGRLDKMTLNKTVERNLAISISALEITALRYHEFDHVMDSMCPGVTRLLTDETELSFHAPSSFTSWQERYITYRLRHIPYDRIPIVLHPDAIQDHENWQQFHGRVRLENMDTRRTKGVTLEQMKEAFELLPDAEWCFDVGHARQVDGSMALAKALLNEFEDRLAEIHMSVVLPSGEHNSLDEEAADDYRNLFQGRKIKVPVILETILDEKKMQNDLRLAVSVFEPALEVVLEPVQSQHILHKGND